MKTGFRKMLAALLVIMILQPLLVDAGLAAVLTFPSRVVRIGDSAFENDRSLDEVKLPDGIESIGSRAFAGAAIRKMNLPSSLNFIADDAFEGAEVGVFEAKRNTWAWQWLDDHNLLLHFSDEAMYDASVDMAVFQPDEAIGLGADWFACWYELQEYEVWKDSAASEPVWSVVQTSGPEAEYALQHYDGQASLSVAMPEKPEEYAFRISCAWAGRSLTTTATVRYAALESPPAGTDIPDEIDLTAETENVLSFHFTPEDLTIGGGRLDRVGFEGYTGEADAWYEGRELHIIPHEKGTFTGRIFLYTGNLYIEKQVTFLVGAVPEQITARMDSLWEEDTGKINLDTLTEISTEDVTDPWELEQIADFNKVLPEMLQEAAAYNAAVDGLFACTGDLTSFLGDVSFDVTDTSCAFTSAPFSFSFGQGVMDVLEGDYEIVSVEAAGNDGAVITLESGEAVRYLQLSETGFRLMDSSSQGNSAAGARGHVARGNDSDDHPILDFIYRDAKAIFDGVLTVAEYGNYINAAGETLARLSEKAGKFIHGPGFQRFGQILSALGDCKSVSNGIIRLTEIWRQYSEILLIAAHGHPSEMEAREPVSLNNAALLMTDAIPRAKLWYCADFAITWALVLVRCTTSLNPRELIKNWGKKYESLGIRIFGLDPAEIVKWTNALVWSAIDKAAEKAHNRFLDAFKEVLSLDRELHYDFFGVVRDQDMNPLQGVLVTLGYNSVYTDARGSYEMEAPESAATPAFTRGGYREVTDQSVTMKPYERAQLDIQMEKLPLQLTGRVYDEKTDQPISGAQVSFNGAYAYSDAEGNYSLGISAGATGVLKAIKTQGYFPWEEPFTVPENQTVVKKDIPMRPAGRYTLIGTVYGEKYDHKLKKWVSSPLPGATVAWSGATAVTGADGTYEISVEEMTSEAMVFSMEPMYVPKEYTKKMWDGTLSPFVVKKNASVTLTIRASTLNVDPYPEHSRDPNAYINSGIRSWSVTIPGVVSDHSDTTIPYVPIGEYDVTVKAVMADGDEEVFAPFTDHVTIKEDEYALLEAPLPWLRGLSGQLIDEDGSPITDMKIEVGSYKQPGPIVYDTYITPDEEGRFYLFNYTSGEEKSFHVEGRFVSMDYLEKDRQTFREDPALTESKTYQVRRTDGKYVRKYIFGVSTFSDETVTKAPVGDVTWEGQKAHIEPLYPGFTPPVYLVATDETVEATVTATYEIDGKQYSVSFSAPIGELSGELRLDAQ